MYLLDTNLVSETIKPVIDAGVRDWLQSVPDHALYCSVLTLGEVQQGVDKLPEGPRRQALHDWLEYQLADWFEERILPVDSRIARRWGSLNIETNRKVPIIDGLLAATALVHDLILVTRNEKDFHLVPGLRLFNPWRA
jgi:toxin FitB